MAGFDIEGARKAGYSDGEIVDHLAAERRFDAASARKSGYSDAEILTHLREPLAPAKPERSTMEQIGRGIGVAGGGANERIAEVVGAVPDLIGAGMRGLGIPGSPKPGFYTDLVHRGINAVVGEPPVPENTTERVLHGAGGGVVDAATTLIPGMAIARTARAGGAAQRIGTQLAAQPAAQVATGAAAGGTSEGTGSPTLGLAVGLGLPVAGLAAGRAITPVANRLAAEQTRLVNVAEQYGIPLRAGEATGSPVLKKIEQTLGQLPGSSAPEMRFTEQQRAAVNRASLSHSHTDADIATSEVLNPRRAEIGGVIHDLANRNVLQVTPQLSAELQQIEDGLRFLMPEVHGPVRARLQQLQEMMIVPPAQGANMTIPGASYRMMDSELGRVIRDTGSGDLRAALGSLRNTLRNAMDASISPADAAEWAQARRDYANLMVTADATSGAGSAAALGNVSPAQLKTAVDRSTGTKAAFGQGDQRDLARIGQSILRLPQDSGTPSGSMWNELLTGKSVGASGLGATIGATIGGLPGAVVGAATPFVLPRLVRGAYMNPLSQAYLRNRAVPAQTMQAMRTLRDNALAQQTAARVNTLHSDANGRRRNKKKD